MNESSLLRDFLVAASQAGDRMFRNNVAKGWIGDAEIFRDVRTVTLYPGDVVIRKGRRLHSGLCEHSADTIGWRTVKIIPEMVGRSVAIFRSVELKTGRTKTTTGQLQWRDTVRAAGGMGILARSVEEALGGDSEWVESLISRD